MQSLVYTYFMMVSNIYLVMKADSIVHLSLIELSKQLATGHLDYLNSFLSQDQGTENVVPQSKTPIPLENMYKIQSLCPPLDLLY